MRTAIQNRDLAVLTGPDAGDILRAALAPAGGQLLDWRPTQVDYQPRRGSTAGYAARVRWADGQVADERFGAFTGTPPAGAVTLGNGEEQVSVWRFPYDPYLPGLAAAYDPPGPPSCGTRTGSGTARRGRCCARTAPAGGP